MHILRFVLILGWVVPALLVGAGNMAPLGATAMASQGPDKPLAMQVADLQLGIGEYRLGSSLSAEKKAAIKDMKLESSYPGTYSFKDGERVVVVADNNDMVLAIYQKVKDAGLQEMQEMVASLMGSFGQPTNEAHDQVIYWAWGEKGRITDTDFEQMKTSGEGRILATVKFSSALPFAKRQGAPEEKGAIHWIISSPLMLAKFVQK